MVLMQKSMSKTLLLAAVVLIPLPAFGDALTDYYDNQLKMVEGDVTRLASTMPADKYDFAPSQGNFKGVRTFSQQVKHLATILYQVSAANLGQKPPVDIGTGDNGPNSVKTKEQVLAYLKGAFEFTHKSIATLNAKNQLERVKGPFGDDMPRLDAGSMPAWHSLDHYGQMVVYARMNGVAPGQPAPPSPAKK